MKPLPNFVDGAAEILLAEDDEYDAGILQSAAARIGLAPEKLVVVGDGEHALRLLCGTRALKQLKLVVLDLKLPKRSGLEVLKRMRAEPRNAIVPAVIMSGSDLPEDLNTCYRAGASGYVVKPPRFEDHVRSAEQMLHYWLKVNTSPYGAA